MFRNIGLSFNLAVEFRQQANPYSCISPSKTFRMGPTLSNLS